MCFVYVPMFLLWFNPFLPHSQIGNIGFHIEKTSMSQKIAEKIWNIPHSGCAATSVSAALYHVPFKPYICELFYYS